MFVGRNFSHQKFKNAQKVPRLVSSIGQDLLYHANNCKKKTSKHTTFPFLIKKKTSFKAVINWLCKFGHGMSYDDVLSLETYLAMEYSKNQNHRSFTPSIIQPSQFITFIWDNNDINPESLKGLGLHCTNGIIVQSYENRSNPAEPSTAVALTTPQTKKPRIRHFKHLLNEIVPCDEVKRKSIEAQIDVDLSLFVEEVERSHMIDTL